MVGTTEALQAELARWSWGEAAWDAIGEESRTAYDHWVRSAWTRGQARRRARVVARRLWSGRPFAAPVRRRLQALGDMVEGPAGDAAMNVDMAPGWIP